jgi:spoIIIJ-associated protein
MTGAGVEPPASDAGADSGTSVEGTGETVGEAKWVALRELERRFPGIDKGSVRFAVLSEGERGLLGVGYAPARVLASVAERPSDAAAGRPERREPPDSPAASLRELLELTCEALGVHASIAISESETGLLARLSGPDLGLLIGKRGQTIDAIQYLANAVLPRVGESRTDVVVDAAGYRNRRRASLERTAERAAREAVSSGEAVALEPMTAAERKVVHVYLQERGDVTTGSEGAEPNRHVVVAPAG